MKNISTRALVHTAFLLSLLCGAAPALAGPAFKSTTDPTTQNHFSNDKNNWWRELPVEALPTRSGIYNQEGWVNEKAALKSLVTGKSTLGDLPVVEAAQSNDGFITIILSRKETDCGTITDEVRLQRKGFADIDGDGVAEQCVFIGRANKSDACHMGSGNFLGYGSWLVFKKVTAKSAVALMGKSESKCDIEKGSSNG